MATVEEIQRKVGPILSKYFTEIMIDSFGDSVRDMENAESLAEPDPTLVHIHRQALIQSFWSTWTDFRRDLFDQCVPVTYAEIRELFSVLFRERNLPITQARTFSEHWEPLLMDDMDTFLIFARMRTDLLAEVTFNQAKTSDEKSAIKRQDKLKRLVRQSFLQTSRQSFQQSERLSVYFWEDLKRAIACLQDQKIKVTVDELRTMIEQEVPIVRDNWNLLGLIRRFEASLDSIVPSEAEALVEIEVEECEVVELTELVEAEIEPDVVKIKTPVFKQQSFDMVIDIADFEVNLPGLIKLIKKLDFNFDQPKAYHDALKNLFYKIMEVCRDNKKLGLLRSLVFQLKTYLERKLAKISAVLSEEDQKNKLMLAALSPFEAQLSELMPSTFSKKDGVSFLDPKVTG
jgi:hypothetical protein